MIRTQLRMVAVPGSAQQLLSTWARAAFRISGVDGCVRQDLLQSTADADLFVVSADWNSPEQLQAYSSSASRVTLSGDLDRFRVSAERETFTLLQSIAGSS